MKILTILGARPQFIKAASVSRALQKEASIQETIVHTGQHYDANMSQRFFEELEIPQPAHILSLHGTSHGAMTGGMMKDIETVIIQEKPDYVMVYGDTNSTLAGALAAKKLHVKVIHVEAGLRSFNMQMPEEINRILTDRISDILFCPTSIAVSNLQAEGFENFNCTIVQNGDVMQDAAMYYAKKSHEKSTVLKELHIKDKPIVLATVHRAENTDNIERLQAICRALEHIHNDTPVILPVHPRTKKVFKQHNCTPNIICIEPVGYFDMIELLKHSKTVITDSGGLQKEAFFFQSPCITVRDETEWVELVERKVNVTTGANTDAIIEAYTSFLSKKPDFSANLYGNGKASETIVDVLRN